MSQQALTLCDSTLRDGSHAVRHRFTVGQVRRVARALDGARVPVVEVSHGDGLGGSSLNYGQSAVDEFELIAAAARELRTARLAVLALPGIATRDDLSRAAELGASVARIATHCTEADIAPQHLRHARALGMSAVGFLMMAHRATPERLAEQGRIMADAGAQTIYVTDSAGALTPDGVRDRVAALRAALSQDVAVGIHAHHNLALSVANSLAAVEAGARWIDGCLSGLGAGAGNTPIEVLAAVCERSQLPTGVDTFTLLDAAEETAHTLGRPNVDRTAIVLGYAGVYSSFLHHAHAAADRFEVSASAVLVEAGRRGAVGGQEDLLLDIAAELAAQPRSPDPR